MSERLPALIPSAPTPESLLNLQRTYGNRATRQALAPGELTVQRALWTKDEWKKTSSIGKFYSRSDPVKAIDNALAVYDALRVGTDYRAKQHALYAVLERIKDWKASKTDPTTAKRYAKIQALRENVDSEIKTLIVAFGSAPSDKRYAAMKPEIDLIVTDAEKTIVDPAARARAVFASYMTHFRGNVLYTLKTVPNISIFVKSDSVACATISYGLRDALAYAGIADAKVKQIGPQKFVTLPLNGGAFIDGSATGNVRTAGQGFTGVKRFFFTLHWVISCPSAGVYFDPTSGIEISDDNATQIVDAQYGSLNSAKVNGKEGYKNSSYQLEIVEGTRHGGGYLLTPVT